jgi:ubiquinone/menaquinone biosynthesis C-methylase UbiE
MEEDMNQTSAMISMDEYIITKKDYDKDAQWHMEKSFSYDGSAEISKFISMLSGKKVLDVGCGTSNNIKIFLDKNISVEGLDYSEAAIKKSRSLYPNVKFHLMDMLSIDLPDESYDGIWASASLLNIKKKDIPLALKNFRRILKEDGILFVSVKAGDGERFIEDNAGKRFFSFFSEQEMKKFLGDAGFETISVDNVKHISPNSTETDPSKPDWVCLYARKK